MEKCRLRLEWVPNAYNTDKKIAKKEAAVNPVPPPSNGLYSVGARKIKRRHGGKLR